MYLFYLLILINAANARTFKPSASVKIKVWITGDVTIEKKHLKEKHMF